MVGTTCQQTKSSIICKEVIIKLTNVGSDTSKDDLALVLRLYLSPELVIIPRIHLSVTADERRIGVHGSDLLGQETVGTCFGAGG